MIKILSKLISIKVNTFLFPFTSAKIFQLELLPGKYPTWRLVALQFYRGNAQVSNTACVINVISLPQIAITD